MHKNLLIFLSITILLTSCGEDKNDSVEKKDNIKASISQTANIDEVTPKVINPDWEDDKNLIVNPKLSEEDKERLNKLKNKDTGFYLFENESYNSQISDYNKRLSLLEEAKVFKINPETQKEYTPSEYISARTKLVDFEHPETWEKSKEKLIDKELFLANSNYKTYALEDFTKYVDDDWVERTYKTSTSQRLFKEAKENSRILANELLAEKKAIEEWDVTKYITLPKSEIEDEISTLKIKIDYLKSAQIENDSIALITKEYKSAVTKWESKYNPEEVKYIFTNVLDMDIDLEMVKNITLKEAKSAIAQFESWDLVKLTKQLPTWMNISSSTLYTKVVWNNWEEYYIDEKMYTSLKHSISVWWENFVIYEDKTNTGYQNKIYSFLTWYNPNQSYYQSLWDLILEKGNIEVHKAVFTLTSKEIKKDNLTYKLYSWNSAVDVNKNWMLTNLLLILTDKKTSLNINISKSQLKDFLINLF